MMSGTGNGVDDGRAQRNNHNQEAVGVGTMPNMHFDGAAVFKPVFSQTSSLSPSHTHHQHRGGGDDSAIAAAASQPPSNLNSGEQTKRRRGRPRKYAPPPGGTVTPGLTSHPQRPPPSVEPAVEPSDIVSPTSTAGLASSSSGGKKRRGRPPGSGQKHKASSKGSAGVGFTPHILTVKAGEDVFSTIMSFFRNGTQAICILSANGAISNVTLRQAATSGGSVTYEGRFEILSLSGSFLLSEYGGQRSRTGALSVSLAGPDGYVLGGGVAGLLIAASPVQVVIGSFMPEGLKDSISEEALNAPRSSFPDHQPLEAFQHSEP